MATLSFRSIARPPKAPAPVDRTRELLPEIQRIAASGKPGELHIPTGIPFAEREAFWTDLNTKLRSTGWITLSGGRRDAGEVRDLVPNPDFVAPQTGRRKKVVAETTVTPVEASNE